jgi:pimeloyl-ACP methyl ester carboxylesterase
LAPVLLLHDSLGSVDQWRDFPAALAEGTGRAVLAYDRLGFGQSTPRRDLPSREFISEEANEVFPVLREALDLRAFVLFGHSVGGAMALAIAASAGPACEGVVTESAQAFVEERTLAGIREARAGFQDPASFQRLVRWHGERARWVLDAWTETWLSPAFRSWNLDAVLPGVICPVLALHGDRDEFGSGAFPERIVGGVAGPARMAILEDCGHVPHRERPEEVVGRVVDFLAGS